jgi:hypothetical protein
VSHRGPFVRLLLWAGLLCAAVVALIGGVALRGSGVVAVALAGAVSACLAAGVSREGSGVVRTRPLEAAVLAAAWTVGVLLVLAGTAALGGGLAAVLTGAGAAVVALTVWLVRAPHPGGTASQHPLRSDVAGPPRAVPSRPVAASPWPPSPTGRADAGGAARLSAPVTELTTAALGREWLRTTAALNGRLEPAARESIVRRRQEALDELERRDADGFARWLAAGPAAGSDPADYVHGDPGTGRAA